MGEFGVSLGLCVCSSVAFKYWTSGNLSLGLGFKFLTNDSRAMQDLQDAVMHPRFTNTARLTGRPVRHNLNSAHAPGHCPSSTIHLTTSTLLHPCIFSLYLVEILCLHPAVFTPLHDIHPVAMFCLRSWIPILFFLFVKIIPCNQDIHF